MKIMHEQWIQLKLIEGLCDKYRIAGVFDGLKLFKIFLSAYLNEGKKAEVLFQQGVSSYRNTNESYRLRIMSDLGKKYGHDFYGRWTFFKINDSEYLQWFLDESSSGNDSSLIHFAFVGDEMILDIIATYQPKVILVQES